jgi:hypothetical protein
VACSRVNFTFTFPFIDNKNWGNTFQRYCTTGPSFSFVFAFHCNYHKASLFIKSRLRCLRVLQTTELHILRNYSDAKRQYKKSIPRFCSGCTNSRLQVAPTNEYCTVNGVVAPRFLENLCNHISDCFPPQKVMCSLRCACPSFHNFQFNLNQLSDFD